MTEQAERDQSSRGQGAPMTSARSFFNDLAEGWNDRFAVDPRMAERFELFEGALRGRAPASARVLDFGCGSGAITRHLAGLGYDMSAVDVSERMISVAKEADPDSRIDWGVCVESAPLPFEDDAFDAVVSSSVLEYVPDLDFTLSEFSRVLREGGVAAITVPDLRHSSRWKEAALRGVLRAPGLGAVAAKTRWAEGAAYLALSVNRLGLRAWRGRLARAGFEAAPTPRSRGPLVLLTAVNMKPAQTKGAAL